jgi:predicted nucleic acid-binding protein
MARQEYFCRNVLITWNTKHFMRKEVLEAVKFKIMTPTEFLEKLM